MSSRRGGGRPKTGDPASLSGFSLAELVVVLVLIGIVLTVALPRFTGFGEAERLRAAARSLANLAFEAHSQAAAKSRPWFLCLDLKTRRAWLSTVRPGKEGDAGRESRDWIFPDDVLVTDVIHPLSGLVREGRLSFGYWPQGGGEPGTIHLKNEDGQELTLFIRPFLGRVDVEEGYLREETR